MLSNCRRSPITSCWLVGLLKQLMGTDRPTVKQLWWQHKLNPGRTSGRPWRRTISHPWRSSGKQSSASEVGSSAPKTLSLLRIVSCWLWLGTSLDGGDNTLRISLIPPFFFRRELYYPSLRYLGGQKAPRYKGAWVARSVPSTSRLCMYRACLG